MAFEDLKKSQGQMWGSGPFEEVEASIADMHERVFEAAGPHDGRTWLDVGCGTGGVSVLAAADGAEVTGVDLAPNLIETATRRAKETGINATYEVGDVEALDFPEGAFEIVTSSVGAIFAPDHAATAAELARISHRKAASRFPRGGRMAESESSSSSCASSSPRRHLAWAIRSTGDRNSTSGSCWAEPSI